MSEYDLLVHVHEVAMEWLCLCGMPELSAAAQTDFSISGHFHEQCCLVDTRSLQIASGVVGISDA